MHPQSSPAEGHPLSPQTSVLKSATSLEALSLAYLTLPVFIFLFGWLHLWIAVVATVGLVAAVVASLRTFGLAEVAHSERDRAVFIITCLLFGLLWVGISGIGGVGYQNGDYSKHNSVFSDLSKRSWPLIYDTADQGDLGIAPVTALVYSLAYYLPSGLAGALAGWTAANTTEFVWGWIGMALSLCWFVRLTALPPWVAGAVFPFLGGLDLIGWYWTRASLPRFTDHIEWWSDFFQYSANSTLLFWVPQHAFSGWIGTGLLVHLHRRRLLSPIAVVTVVTVVSYWSVFAALGLGLLTAPSLVKIPLWRWRRLELIGPIALVIILFLFVRTNHNPIDHGFFWFFGKPNGTGIWLMFCILEFGLALGLTLLLCRAGDVEDKKWLIWCAVFLTVLTFFKLGFYNDLVTRASIPPLLVLWALVLHHLYYCKQKLRSFTWVALAAVMIVGALSASTEIIRAVRLYHLGPPPQVDVVPAPHSLYAPLVKQYFAAPDSLFFRYLARKRTVDYGERIVR